MQLVGSVSEAVGMAGGAARDTARKRRWKDRGERPERFGALALVRADCGAYKQAGVSDGHVAEGERQRDGCAVPRRGRLGRAREVSSARRGCNRRGRLRQKRRADGRIAVHAQV